MSEPITRARRRRPRGQIRLDRLGATEIEGGFLIGIPIFFVVALFFKTTAQDPPTAQHMWDSLHGQGAVGIVVALGLFVGILIAGRKK